jgi:hypothetical protein
MILTLGSFFVAFLVVPAAGAQDSELRIESKSSPTAASR